MSTSVVKWWFNKVVLDLENQYSVTRNKDFFFFESQTGLGFF